MQNWYKYPIVAAMIYALIRSDENPFVSILVYYCNYKQIAGMAASVESSLVCVDLNYHADIGWWCLDIASQRIDSLVHCIIFRYNNIRLDFIINNSPFKEHT